MAKVSYQQLRALGACAYQLQLFRDLFGEAAEVTPERCVEVADHFDWDWAAARLLPPSARAAYDEATAQERGACGKATAPDWAAYDKATAPARAAYDKAVTQERGACGKATAQAWVAYGDATAQAWAAHYQALSQARAAYGKATARAFGELYQGEAANG